jgi:HD-like signal output (HDOD) protein
MATAISARTDAAGADAGKGADTRLRDSIAAGQFEVPMLSRAAGEVIALCSGDGVDARALALKIQQDPALAAEVLRIANCASFAGGSPVVSLQQAIARMGLDRIREIALAIALKSDLFRSRDQEARLRAVWRDAVAAAAWAREVARACRVNAEMAYLGGLLHNIGIPVLLRTVERLGIVLDEAALAHALDAHAAAAGVALVRRWSLPPQVAAVIRDHRSEACDDVTVKIVATAIWLIGVDPDADAASLIGAPEFGRVNLYPEDVERLWRGREKVAQLVDALAL